MFPPTKISPKIYLQKSIDLDESIEILVLMEHNRITVGDIVMNTELHVNAPDNAPDVGLEQGAYWPMCSPTKLLSYIDRICDLKLFTDVAAIIFLLSLFHGFITRWL